MDDPPMAILSKERQLHKELTLFDVYTIATGATLSSGFFLLPGLAAAEAGPAVVLSYFLAVLPMLPGILSKIELATAMPTSGGTYVFVDRAFGPLAGTVTGLGLWLSFLLKSSFCNFIRNFFTGILTRLHRIKDIKHCNSTKEQSY